MRSLRSIALSAGVILLVIVFKVSPVSTLFQKSVSGLTQTSAETPLKEPFIARDAGFQVSFPTVPVRKEKIHTSADPAENGTQITYTSTKGDTAYYVDTTRFTDTRLDEKHLSDEAIKAALHEGVQAIVEGEDTAHISRSNYISFQGHVALRYTIGKTGEHLDGLIFMNGNRYYNIMVDGDPNTDPSPSFEEFIATFLFIAAESR